MTVLCLVTTWSWLSSLNTYFMTQRHHIIALSIGGIHCLHKDAVNEANLVVLEETEHKKLHKVLDIPYDFIRAFRMKYEVYQFKDADYYNDLHKLQLMYFSNLKHLSQRIIALHLESIKGQNRVFAKMFNWNGSLYENAIFVNDLQAFEFYLAIYHKIFVSRATYYLK